MEFHNIEDKIIFLAEIGVDITTIEENLEEYKPTQKMLELFDYDRSTLLASHRNFRKSQAAKMGWRRNKYAYKKGITRYHKSTEGKRFHRNLGRFLATHSGIGNMSLLRNEFVESIKALSSCEQHIFIELNYYHNLNEEKLYQDFMEEVLPVIHNVKEKLLNAYVYFDGKPIELTEEEIDVISDLVHPWVYENLLEDEFRINKELIKKDLNKSVEKTDSYLDSYKELREKYKPKLEESYGDFSKAFAYASSVGDTWYAFKNKEDFLNFKSKNEGNGTIFYDNFTEFIKNFSGQGYFLNYILKWY